MSMNLYTPTVLSFSYLDYTYNFWCILPAWGIPDVALLASSAAALCQCGFQEGQGMNTCAHVS